VAVDEHRIKRSMEQARYHLARAESELQAAQRDLDPKADDEFERDLIRAVGNARTSVGDALETIRARLWE
jgi:vacuolar-type H+-ATPase subunit H